MLNQNDTAWKLKRINGTTSTLGSYGCLITDICWLLNQAGYKITPDVLATKSELFDGAYWIGWAKLGTLFPKMNYVWGELCKDYPAPIEKIIKEIDDGFYPIIMLDYAPKVTGLQTHYLLCIGHDDKGNLKVGDPIDGQEVWLDSRYGELDEKYKIMKVDVFHFKKPIQNTPDLWEKIKGLLTQENNYSEGDIRDMVDWYKQKDSTERVITELNSGITSKQAKLAEKDQIIFELNNKLNGQEETIRHDKEFLDKISVILRCEPIQGEILASTAIAIGNESKLVACLSDRQLLLRKIDVAIAEGVDKQTFELRLKLAQNTMELDKKNKDIVIYQKKIDELTLGKTVVQRPLFLKIRNLINKLLKKDGKS